MLNKTCDERQIQRCLDNELSPDETRLLLLQLNELPEGWKILACGFLEERSFANAVRGWDLAGCAGQASVTLRPDARQTVDAQRGSATPPEIQLPPTSSEPATVPVRHRPTAQRHEFRVRLARSWSHPLVSLSLCAAIAFVAGLIVQDGRSPDGTAALTARNSQNQEFPDSVDGSAIPQAVILSVSGNSGKSTADQSLADVNQKWLQELQQNLQSSGYSVRLRQIRPNIMIDNSSDSRHIMSLLQQLAEQMDSLKSGIPAADERVPVRSRP